MYMHLRMHARGRRMGTFRDRGTTDILVIAASCGVIQGSRDVQKLSKQAIFSVHRGRLDEARQQLAKAEQCRPLHINYRDMLAIYDILVFISGLDGRPRRQPGP